MDLTPSQQRLQRLLGYLELDADNDLLRQDAIATACEAGEADVARRLLEERLARGDAGAMPWGHWVARIALAEQDWDGALQQWQRLAGDGLLPLDARQQAAASASQLQLRLGRVEDAVAALTPWLQGQAPDAPISDGLQAAWLRVLHHAGQLREGYDWAMARRAVGHLAADAVGVASMMAMDLGDGTASDELAREALAALPGQVEARLVPGALSMLDASPADALALNERVAEALPNSGRAWTHLGAARMLVRDLPGARVAYARATELMPGHVGSWHGLAWVAMFAEDMVEAERLLDHALELDRNFAETHGTLAVVYARTGRRQMALEALRRARGLDANSFAAHYAQALLDQPNLSAQEANALAAKLLDGQVLPNGRRASSLLGLRA